MTGSSIQRILGFGENNKTGATAGLFNAIVLSGGCAEWKWVISPVLGWSDKGTRSTLSSLDRKRLASQPHWVGGIAHLAGALPQETRAAVHETTRSFFELAARAVADNVARAFPKLTPTAA